jgi:hypothetical protein
MKIKPNILFYLSDGERLEITKMCKETCYGKPKK